MEQNQRNTKGPILKMFLFFSELLGRSVIDSQGEPLGKLADLKARLGEPYPKVVTLAVKRRRERKPFALDWSEVQSLNGNIISLKQNGEKMFLMSIWSNSSGK